MNRELAEKILAFAKKHKKVTFNDAVAISKDIVQAFNAMNAMVKEGLLCEKQKGVFVVSAEGDELAEGRRRLGIWREEMDEQQVESMVSSLTEGQLAILGMLSKNEGVSFDKLAEYFGEDAVNSAHELRQKGLVEIMGDVCYCKIYAEEVNRAVEKLAAVGSRSSEFFASTDGAEAQETLVFNGEESGRMDNDMEVEVKLINPLTTVWMFYSVRMKTPLREALSSIPREKLTELFSNVNLTGDLSEVRFSARLVCKGKLIKLNPELPLAQAEGEISAIIKENATVYLYVEASVQ